MNTSILSALPNEVKAGDEIEVQLAPRGEYPQTVDGREVVQIIDDRSIKSLVANFAKAKEEAKAKGENYQVLVDADHASETGNGTRAMAWVDRVFDDPDRGLVGVFVFTPEGAEAVSGKTYRFISPAWTLNPDGRPETLVSVGMTNTPNLPVSPMLNAKAANDEPTAGDPALTTVGDEAVTHEEAVEKAGEPKAANAEEADCGETENPNNSQEKEENIMDIRAKLSLPAEATDDEVEQAIDALLARCEAMEQVENALGFDPATATNEEVLEAVNAVIGQCGELQAKNEEAEKARLNAEADELVSENADVIPEESVEDIKNAYEEDPEAAKATVANMRRVYERALNSVAAKAAKPKAVINWKSATRPAVHTVANARDISSCLADCGGDPAKENAMIARMAGK